MGPTSGSSRRTACESRTGCATPARAPHSAAAAARPRAARLALGAAPGAPPPAASGARGSSSGATATGRGAAAATAPAGAATALVGGAATPTESSSDAMGAARPWAMRWVSGRALGMRAPMRTAGCLRGAQAMPGTAPWSPRAAPAASLRAAAAVATRARSDGRATRGMPRWASSRRALAPTAEAT